MKGLLLVLFLSLSLDAFAIEAPFQPWEVDLVDKNIIDLASAKIIVGNSKGKVAAVTMSGDATLSNAGALTLASGAVETSMIADGSVSEAKLAVPTADGLNAHRIARATYDVAVDGGAIGAYGLGVSLPANAIMIRSWFYTVTQFVDAGSGTVALHCETAGNIYAAADITGNADGAIVDGVQDDTTAKFDGTGAAGVLGSACELTATVATAEQSAGKLVLFVEYVVAE